MAQSSNVSPASSEELDKAGAELLLQKLGDDYHQAKILTGKKHQVMANFRRTALKLCEGKGYKQLLNVATGKPFSTIEELAQEAFGLKRIMMQGMLRAARTEREMFLLCTFVKGHRDVVDTPYRFLEAETPTVYALETLRMNVSTAQNRVDVYFYAKHHAPEWSNKSYPAAEDIKRAAHELKLYSVDGNYNEGEECSSFHLDELAAAIRTAAKPDLHRLQHLIKSRLAEL